MKIKKKDSSRKGKHCYKVGQNIHMCMRRDLKELVTKAGWQSIFMPGWKWAHWDGWLSSAVPEASEETRWARRKIVFLWVQMQRCHEKQVEGWRDLGQEPQLLLITDKMLSISVGGSMVFWCSSHHPRDVHPRGHSMSSFRFCSLSFSYLSFSSCLSFLFLTHSFRPSFFPPSFLSPFLSLPTPSPSLPSFLLFFFFILMYAIWRYGQNPRRKPQLYPWVWEGETPVPSSLHA